MPSQVLDQVLQSPRLPSLPAIALEVIELVQKRDVNIKQIAHTISHDPALTGRLLKVVNSSFYGQAYAVSSISHALVVLGLNSVKTMALGFTLVGNLKTSAAEGFDHLAYWKNSLYSAAAAKAIAKLADVPQQEEVFIAALLQDMGQLALSQTMGSTYHRAIATAGQDRQKLLTLERQALDTDHTEVGGALADQWKLPPVLALPIRLHETPEAAPEDARQIVRCVSMGGYIADVFVSENSGVALRKAYDQGLAWFNLSPEATDRLINAVHNDSVELSKLFELPTGKLEDPAEILARASEALLHVGMQTARDTSDLEEKNRQLQAKATTDPLTRVANRGHFNEVIATRFAEAMSSGKPLSVLFLDTDKFKSFNDTYGHQTGDRVLVEKAKAIQSILPPNALLARYGGEEFAIVLPETDRLTAARLAEKVRLQVASITITSDAGQALHVTTSVGVATQEGRLFESPEQLVKAADRGVYAAKASGRNCVRVYVPKLQRTA